MASEKHEVGYGKPPKHTQFKPGQSGNPKGRPKGTKNFRTDLIEELGELIAVREGGRERSLSKQRAIIKTLCAKAANGDVRAISAVINLLLKVTEPAADVPADQPLNREDQAILQDYLERQSAVPKRAETGKASKRRTTNAEKDGKS